MILGSILLLVVPATQASTPLICNMVTETDDDDGSFQMNLPFSLTLGETDYNQVYYSTNGTMTFGQPDGTYWDYPETPSVSLAGYDWVSLGEGAYTSYGYNDSSFCIEWSVRPFPQDTGELTQIRLVVNKFSNGSWHGEITTLGWTPDNIRRGIRSVQGGTVVTMGAAFDVNGGTPTEAEPQQTSPSFTDPPAIPIQCWDGSTVYEPSPCPIEPTPTPIAIPEPEQSSEPTPTVVPSPQPSEPSPEPSQTSQLPTEPSSTPTPLQPELVTPRPETTRGELPQPDPLIPSEITPSPIEIEIPSSNNNIINNELTKEQNIALEELLTKYGPMDAISFEDFENSGLDYENLPPDQPILLENGAILTAEVADAIEILEDAGEFLLTVFTDPGKAIKAMANIGADMTPEKRKESQQVIVASVIVAQIAVGLSTKNNIGGK
jgi:hypothetical protein